MDDLDEILELFKEEYLNARKVFDPMHSRHEGYAVLLEEVEEVEEMWDEIKADAPTDKVRKETIQVGAMALAIMWDVLNKEEFGVRNDK